MTEYKIKKGDVVKLTNHSLLGRTSGFNPIWGDKEYGYVLGIVIGTESKDIDYDPPITVQFMDNGKINKYYALNLQKAEPSDILFHTFQIQHGKKKAIKLLSN